MSELNEILEKCLDKSSQEEQDEVRTIIYYSPAFSIMFTISFQ